MNRLLSFRSVALIGWGVLWLLTAQVCRAQYELPDNRDTTIAKDTTGAVDTSRTPPDTTRAPEESEEQAARPFMTPEKAVIERATTWLRRMLYRGKLDATVIGAYAQYQITAWSENVGSYGPVEARMTISYLGTSQFLGKNAEWLQAAYQTVEEEAKLVEFDLLLPSAPHVVEIYRVIYRVNRGEMHSLDLNLPPDKIDYDRNDRPESETTEELNLYSGKYVCEKLRGAGVDGADVVIYRSDKVKPLCIVRLGYGGEGMTYTGGGNDAVARFNIAPPPSPR